MVVEYWLYVVDIIDLQIYAELVWHVAYYIDISSFLVGFVQKPLPVRGFNRVRFSSSLFSLR